MSPELITAVKQRITAGQTKESIKTEVLAMGHAELVFESVYTLALHDLEKLAMPGVTPSVAAELPSAYELLENALSFVCKRLDIVLLVLVPGLVFFAFSYAGERVAEPQLLSGAIDAFSLIAFLVYMMAIFSAMYMVSGEDKAVTYTEGLLWAKRNVFSIFWISILMLFVIAGGLALFIIPGVILSLTLYFSQYALILENQKGTAALARSRDLVRGRFVAVGLKLAAFTFYILAPVFLAMVVVVVIATTQPALMKFSLVGEIGMEIVSALITIIGIHAMSRLYRALVVGRPLTEVSKIRSGIYWFLAFIGVAAIAALVAIAMYFVPDLDEKIMGDSYSLQSEVQTMTTAATSYALDHNGSFAGVCDTLRTQAVSADSVECNDSETQWSVLGMVGEERWCADTTTIAKQVNSALGDRLTCLNLPQTQPLEVSNEATTTTDSPTE